MFRARAIFCPWKISDPYRLSGEGVSSEEKEGEESRRGATVVLV